MADTVLRAFSSAWASAERDLKKWLDTRDNRDLAKVQASLADNLRNLLPLEDPFARDRIAMLSLHHFREALTTVDILSPQMAMAQAKSAWAKEAYRVRTLAGDADKTATRAEKMERIVGLTWTWQAKLDGKTCAYCVAMHGTAHPLGIPMASHPNCRCMPVPDKLPSGWTWLRKQSIAVQDATLGRPVATRWRQGELGPDQIIDYNKHRRRSLRAIFGERMKRTLQRRGRRKESRRGRQSKLGKR